MQPIGIEVVGVESDLDRLKKYDFISKLYSLSKWKDWRNEKRNIVYIYYKDNLIRIIFLAFNIHV